MRGQGQQLNGSRLRKLRWDVLSLSPIDLSRKIGDHWEKIKLTRYYKEIRKGRNNPDPGAFYDYENKWPVLRESAIIDAILNVCANEIVNKLEYDLNIQGNILDNREQEKEIRKAKLKKYLEVMPYDSKNPPPLGHAYLPEKEAEALLSEIMEYSSTNSSQLSEPTTANSPNSEITVEEPDDYPEEFFLFPELKRHTEREYFGREEIRSKIKEFLSSADHGLFLITGPPGIGKTALMANLFFELQPFSSKNRVHYFSFRRDSARSSLSTCIKHLYNSFITKHNITAKQLPENVEEAASQFKVMLQQFEHMSSKHVEQTQGEVSITDKDGEEINADGQAVLESNRQEEAREIFLIDAVDESKKPLLMLQLLPKEELPQNAYFILTSRYHTDLEVFTSFPNTHKPLDISSSEEQNVADSAKFLKTKLPDWSSHIVKQIAHVARGNFRFLELYVSYVKQKGIHESKGVCTAKELGGDEEDPLCAIYKKYWIYLQDVCSAKEWRQAKKLVGILAVAYTELSLEQLKAFLGSSWIKKHFETSLRNVRQFIQTYNTKSANKIQTVYGLYDDTFETFIKMHLDAELTAFQDCIVNYYMPDIDSPLLISRLDDYGLNHLVKHVSFSNTPMAIHNIISPEFVRQKRKLQKSIAPILDDLSAVILICAKHNELISVLKYCLLREQLAHIGDNSFLVLETLLRARKGEFEGLLEDIDYYGTMEDQILVKAEMVVQQWEKEPNIANIILMELVGMPLEKAPEALLLASMRIADVAPVIALEMGKRLPEPQMLYNWVDDIENPTKGAFYFSYFNKIANNNLALALEIAGSENDISEKIYAHIAIGCSLIPKHIQEGIKSFKVAVSLVKAKENQEILKLYLARYVYWHIKYMDSKTCLETLKEMCEFINFEPCSIELATCVDDKIVENPDFWIKSLEELSPRDSLREYLLSRLIAHGYIDLPCIDEIQHPRIQDIIRAESIIRSAKDNPISAVEMAEELGTLAGYGKAIAGILNTVAAIDVKTSERLVDYILDSKDLDKDWEGFYVVLEMLKATIMRKGKTRQRVLALCFEITLQLEPEDQKQDAIAEIERILANSICSAVPNESDFIISLISELTAESSRYFLARFLLNRLPSEFYDKIINKKDKYGLIKPSKRDLNFPEKLLLLPETQIDVLLFLAEKATLSNVNTAYSAIISAVDILELIEDEDERSNYASRITYKAMMLSPNISWEIIKKSKCSNDDLISLVRDFLKELSARSTDYSERYIRVNLELLLVADCSDAYKTRFSSDVPGLLAIAKNSKYPAIHDNPIKPPKISEDILKQIPDFLIRWFENSTPLRKLSFAFHEFVKIVEGLGWHTFEQVIKKIHFRERIIDDINFRPRIKYTFETKEDASRILASLAEIKKLKISNNNLSSNYELLIVMLATTINLNIPSFLELFELLSCEHREEFINSLDKYKPLANWEHNQLKKLLDLIDEIPNKEDAMICKVQFLTSLGNKCELNGMLPTEDEILQLKQISSKRTIARLLKSLNSNLSTKIFLKALEESIELQDVSEICETVDEFEAIDKNIARRALKLAFDLGCGTEGKSRRGKIAVLQTKYNIDDALLTYISLNPDDDGLGDVAQAIAEAINIHDTKDISNWTNKIIGQSQIKGKHKDKLICGFIRINLKNGVDRSIINDISDESNIIEILLEMAINTDPYNASCLLEATHKLIGSSVNINNRANTLCSVAECYLSFDQKKAFDLFAEALQESSHDNIADVFFFHIQRISRSCLKMELEYESKLAVKIYNTIQKYPYGRNWRESNDMEANCLFWAGTVYWPFDKIESQKLIKKAISKYYAALNNYNTRFYTWEYNSIWASSELSAHYGIEAGNDLLNMLIDFAPEGKADEIIENIAIRLCNPSCGDQPLEHIEIYCHRLSEISCLMLRSMSSKCSLRTKAIIHLSLGISAWEKSHNDAINEIELAKDIAEKFEMTSQNIISIDLWMAYAAMNGMAGCLKAVEQLSKDPLIIISKLPLLFKLALEATQNKLEFINQVIVSMISLEEYNSTSHG